MVRKVNTCMFVYKIDIYAVNVDDCIFWNISQSDIDNAMKSFK